MFVMQLFMIMLTTCAEPAQRDQYSKSILARVLRARSARKGICVLCAHSMLCILMGLAYVVINMPAILTAHVGVMTGIAYKKAHVSLCCVKIIHYHLEMSVLAQDTFLIMFVFSVQQIL